jgi:hypothetical protein
MGDNLTHQDGLFNPSDPRRMATMAASASQADVSMVIFGCVAPDGP